MSEALKTALAAVADSRRAAPTLDEATKARIDADAVRHAVDHFANHLDAGLSEEDATARAIDEHARTVAHLEQTALAHAAAEDSAKRTLRCGACRQPTAHVLTTDKNGETVATCLCGRFQKFPADHVFEDAQA